MDPPKGYPDLKAPVYKHDDWPKGERAFIPDRAKFADYVPNLDVLYSLWVSVLRNNKKALVVGPTGSGKTSLQEYFCAFINQPIYRINGRGDMESDTILGRPWVEEGNMRFEKGELVKAAEKGWWILIDEPWKLPSPIQMALQRFYEKDGQFQLDDMQGEIEDKIITPKATCRIVLAYNVVGTGDNVDQYAATMIQDGSTLNRLDVVFHQPYMGKDMEIKMLQQSVPENTIREDDLERMVDFCRLCRTSYEQRALSAALSPRNLLTWAELCIELQSLHLAAKWTLVHRFAEDEEKQLVNEHYRAVFDEELLS
jgi:MoxR-like ATPase